MASNTLVPRSLQPSDAVEHISECPDSQVNRNIPSDKVISGLMDFYVMPSALLRQQVSAFFILNIKSVWPG
jgi:hypothetical protein